MADNKSSAARQEKTALCEKLWLAYFNAYLYEQGMITESQRNRMIAKIENRKGSTGKVLQE